MFFPFSVKSLFWKIQRHNYWSCLLPRTVLTTLNLTQCLVIRAPLTFLISSRFHIKIVSDMSVTKRTSWSWQGSILLQEKYGSVAFTIFVSKYKHSGWSLCGVSYVASSVMSSLIYLKSISHKRTDVGQPVLFLKQSRSRIRRIVCYWVIVLVPFTMNQSPWFQPD